MAVKCFVCNGRGSDYCWADRDPVEGYKLAPKHTCLFCDGRGMVPDDDRRMPGVLAYIQALADVEQARISERDRREADRARLERSAREKLTTEELDALGLS